MESKTERMQQFYEREKALVTSPFIELSGKLNRELMATVFNRLGIQPDNKVIVDVGCGTGLLATMFQDAPFYIGLDLVCHPTLKGLADDQHQFVQADAQVNPLADSSVDFLICLDSFEHYPDQPKAAAEFYRVLKPGASMFLSIPNYSNIAGKVKRRMEKTSQYDKNTWAPFDYWKPEELEHFVTPSLVRKVFGDAGFTGFKMMGYDKELVVGMVPWIWHPDFPGKLASFCRRSFALFAKPVTHMFPHWSLHTFWKISK